MTKKEVQRVAAAASAFVYAYACRADDAPHETLNEGGTLARLVEALREAGKVT